MPARIVAAGLVLFALLGCSSRSGGAAGAQGASATSQLITEDELAQVGSLSTYDAIVRLRANFLTSSRGKTSINMRGGIRGSDEEQTPLPTLFVDGIEVGSLQQLREIPASQVRQVELYRASQVPQRYGPRHPSGVIEVRLKH